MPVPPLESRMILMLIRKHKIFLYFLFLFILFQSRNICADDNIYRKLIDKDIATYEDGCRAILCFVDMPAETMTFGPLTTELKNRDIIGKRWKYKADKPLKREIMAYMICKVLKIKGGLTMRIFGITKRYAYLECQQRIGIMPTGNSRIYLSGHDLLAVVYRMEQYIKIREMKKNLKHIKK